MISCQFCYTRFVIRSFVSQIPHHLPHQIKHYFHPWIILSVGCLLSLIFYYIFGVLRFMSIENLGTEDLVNVVQSPNSTFPFREKERAAILLHFRHSISHSKPLSPSRPKPTVGKPWTGRTFKRRARSWGPLWEGRIKQLLTSHYSFEKLTIRTGIVDLW